MAWNVPDDWGCYYRKCHHCGARYHLSEGGCDCDGDAKEEAQRGYLERSGYEWDEGSWMRIVSSSVHTCRRDHADGRVKKGDKYNVTVRRYIDDERGCSSLDKQKRILTKGKK